MEGLGSVLCFGRGFVMCLGLQGIRLLFKPHILACYPSALGLQGMI